jgi:hypothetical protein
LFILGSSWTQISAILTEVLLASQHLPHSNTTAREHTPSKEVIATRKKVSDAPKKCITQVLHRKD